jgi:hypothetical protein
MGEFAQVIQPHLDAHVIEGPEDLVKKVWVAGAHRCAPEVCAPEVRRWMDGELRYAVFRDLEALEHILNLSD